jgi:hypothetical protein
MRQKAKGKSHHTSATIHGQRLLSSTTLPPHFVPPDYPKRVNMYVAKQNSRVVGDMGSQRQKRNGFEKRACRMSQLSSSQAKQLVFLSFDRRSPFFVLFENPQNANSSNHRK